ncbi:DUF3253 domain-containing protein [Mycobacterium colombiense]|uniref:DUF3253 domain-containing protein n=1 Tax=Mycobacterium colombiense TaxID=339268 RepID=UPI0009E4BFBB
MMLPPPEQIGSSGAQMLVTLEPYAGLIVRTAARAATRLAGSGEVEITQRGKVVDPGGNWGGPIRIRTTGP